MKTSNLNYSRTRLLKLLPCLIAFLLFAIPSISQPSEDEILESIDDGVTWVVAQQNGDGSWGSSERVANTGFALTKLCDYAYEHGYESPFDPDYEYVDYVEDGFDFLFSQAKAPTTGPGIYMLEGTNLHHQTYNASVALMALAATHTPDRVIDYSSNDLVDDLTFQELVDENVEFFEWGQNDNLPPTVYYGGWGYSANYGWSDNSHTGYVILGLRYAEAMGSTIPQNVKDELSVWIDQIQNDDNGGSGYQVPTNWVNSLKTGNLLFEMAFYGDPITLERVEDAIDYIGAHWNDPGTGSVYNTGWENHLQAIFCLMKGFESYDIDFINDGTDDIDWFIEFTTYLVGAQNPDGSWNSGYWGTSFLNTCWALFVLEKIVPNNPPVAVCENISVFTDENCEGHAIATDFDGGSYDADDDPLTFEVSPAGPYPLGTTAVTLTVTDDSDDSDDCEATITVIDDDPPVVDLDALSILEGECSVEIATYPTATDNCSGALTGTTSDPLLYTDQGTYTVTWTYDDGNGNTTTQEQTIVVEDVTPPTVVAITDPIVMWPPNHKYESFDMYDFITLVSDNCTDLEIGDVYFKSASSDEPEDANGNGDGRTLDDIVLAEDCMSLQLRKERAGNGNGRFYTVYLEADDGNGNFTEVICHVAVPHNPGSDPINDDAVYWEFTPCDEYNKSSIVLTEKTTNSELKLYNYPNPFDGKTTIAFTTDKTNHATLTIYDMLGHTVETLFEGELKSGKEYTVEFNVGILPKGLYFCNLQSGNTSVVYKMLYTY